MLFAFANTQIWATEEINRSIIIDKKNKIYS